jgi:undecaprenyl phosphate-alpha-L-ara4FN deformylase
MLRSKAASLYGWDILLAGTFWPGREIGAALGQVLRVTEAAGHEVGLHAWDHHKWQVAALRMSRTALQKEIRRGIDAFHDALGHAPDCTAAAGWICNETVLTAKEEFPFRYNSDCRGRTVFVPIVDCKRMTPQIPTTLPTYDEVIGQNGVSDVNYNAELFRLILPDRLNVLTIHAEVEGLSRASLFESFLDRCRERRIVIKPLGSVLETAQPLPSNGICLAPVPGRDGDLCWQLPAGRG